MDSCITPEDLLNYPRCCNLTNQICCPNEGIQEALDCAYEKISTLLCQEYCPYEQCKVFDGNGSCKLFMNQELQSLISINILDCGENCPKCECKDTCNCSECKEPELPCITGTMLEYRCEGEFPCGTKNIEVCGLWGSEMPRNVKKAIIYLAMEEISPGIMGLSSCGSNVKSVAWDDYSISYNDSSNTQYTTGFVEIDQMLIPYINSEAQIALGATSNCNCKKPNCRKCNVY